MIETLKGWNEETWFRVIVWFVVLFSVAGGVYYVAFNDTWFDETDHGYKAWLTAEGAAYPFRDFVLKYGPVAFFTEVAVQELSGPSVLASRVVSALFFAAMVLLLFGLLERLADKWLALVGVVFLVFHPYLVGKFLSGLPLSLIGFFTLLSLWFLTFDRISLSWRVLFSSIAMTIAVLTRYNMLPALLLLTLFVWLNWKSARLLALSILGSLGTIIVLWTPYALIDFEYAFSFFLVMFGPFSHLIPLDFFRLGGFLNGEGSPFSLFAESRLKLIMNVLTTYFHFWVLLLAGVIFTAPSWVTSVRHFFAENSWLVLSFFLTAATFGTHFFLGPTYHKIYSLYGIPFLIVTVMLILSLLSKYMKQKGVFKTALPPVIAVSVAVLVLVPFSISLADQDTIFFNRFNWTDSDLARLDRGGEFLASLTTRGDVILTLDNPDHVFVAGRYMIPERINRHDSFVDSPDRARLERFARYNSDMFVEWMTSRATVFVVQRDTWQERLEPIAGSSNLVEAVPKILSEGYELVGSIERVYPLKDRRSDIMDVYRRKTL